MVDERTRAFGYAACAWAAVFAAISFYWGLGGTFALDTLGLDLERRAREGEAVSLGIGPGVLKLALAALALALAHPPRSPSRRVVSWVALAAGVGMSLYGLLMTGEKLLMKVGPIDVPASLGSERVGWYLFLWDPFWLLGGVLFIAAALAARAGSPTPSAAR
ncbi:MAG: DUF3995 domain-containing protein [Solirubrobacterales bacterium]|nr:DUF3995 domain-containing protein [Solirubrobacterales bacterium]